MEKQAEIVAKVLKRLSAAGVLDHVLLIGSWCARFYEDYFSSVDYFPKLKTRDIDFLVSRKAVFSKQVDLEEMLAPLGFEVEFMGKGYMRLTSDELNIEFLVHEIGAGSDRPFPLKGINFNAQPLRHLSMLWRDPMNIKLSGIKVKLPHPADFALQKLIAAAQRKKATKREKDR